MKVLIVGGAGFLGSHLYDVLTARGVDVDVEDDLSTCWLELDLPKFLPREKAETAAERKGTDYDVAVFLNLRHPLEREIECVRIALSSFVGGNFSRIVDLSQGRRCRRVIVGSSLTTFSKKRSPDGMVCRSLLPALEYLHRPPFCSVEMIHLPSLYGPRQLPDLSLILQDPMEYASGLDVENLDPFGMLADVRDAAEFLADRVSAPPMKDVQVALLSARLSPFEVLKAVGEKLDREIDSYVHRTFTRDWVEKAESLYLGHVRSARMKQRPMEETVSDSIAFYNAEES